MAKEPPSQRVSQASRWVTEEQLGNVHYDYGLGRYVIPATKKVRRKWTTIVTTYSGGRVLGHVKATVFRRLHKVSVLKGGMIELGPEQFEKVKGKMEGTNE